MRPAMSSEKKTETATRKKYSASTRPAIVDARSGNNGVPVHMSVSGSSLAYKLNRTTSPLTSKHDDDEGAEREHGRGAGEPHRAHDDQPVAPGHRVVVVAVQQQRIDRRADLPGRRFDDAVAQVAGAVLDAEEVPGEPAVRRQHDDAARMRELPGVRIPGVPEAGSLRQAIDRRLIAGEEMPAFGGAGL